MNIKELENLCEKRYDFRIYFAKYYCCKLSEIKLSDSSGFRKSGYIYQPHASFNPNEQ